MLHLNSERLNQFQPTNVSTCSGLKMGDWFLNSVMNLLSCRRRPFHQLHQWRPFANPIDL